MAGRSLFVIIDGDRVAEWQRRALATLDAEDRLTIVSCTNTSIPRLWRRHPLYYALNLVSVRMPLTRQVPLTGISAQIVARHDFAASMEGAWQSLPAEIVATIRDARPDAVIKLGMTLMRVPETLTVPILSWHHGDPDAFRGRPAGFYEMLQGRRTMGQIVQRISNRLDAGAVVAYAETRVAKHSWRATLAEAFRHSPLLLGEALDNIAQGRVIDKRSDGPNYRLPSNAKVARLTLAMAARAAGRLAYGLVVEKNWSTSTAPVGSVADAAAILAGQRPFPAPATWKHAAQTKDHVFQADPFFVGGGTDIVVEALSAATGKGELVLIRGDGTRARLSHEPGHFSYPATVTEDGIEYLVPEIAGWSSPKAYRIEAGELREVATLAIAGEPRVSDPTFHRTGGRLWLFGNVAGIGSNALYLWSATSLFDRFEPHPMNPIRVSPRGARMGGAIIVDGARTIRLGQNFIDGYGDGLFAFAIEDLSATGYRETEIGALRFDDRRGPHTFNISADGTQIVFDWYRDRMTPMAGIRRLRNRRRATD